jgi:hypothetical protein
VRPAGNSRQRSLRKLRVESERSAEVAEVYRKVLAGEISPHAGMIECGFRKRLTGLEQAQRACKKLSAADRK